MPLFIASSNAYGSTFASLGYTTGNTRLRFILSCFVIPSRSIRHNSRFNFNRRVTLECSLSEKKQEEKSSIFLDISRISSRINVNVEWSEMKCIAITNTQGQLCQTISLDHGDCSFIMTQIIRTGTISDNIGFSFTTASDNVYLDKVQKHVPSMVAR